jgi:hypothetical protein
MTEEQSLLRKTLYVINSVLSEGQIRTAEVWVGLYKRRVKELGKEVPSIVEEALHRKIQQKAGDKEIHKDGQMPGRLDPSRLSNRLQLRDKIERWEARGKVGRKEQSK